MFSYAERKKNEEEKVAMTIFIKITLRARVFYDFMKISFVCIPKELIKNLYLKGMLFALQLQYLLQIFHFSITRQDDALNRFCTIEWGIISILHVQSFIEIFKKTVSGSKSIIYFSSNYIQQKLDISHSFPFHAPHDSVK